MLEGRFKNDVVKPTLKQLFGPEVDIYISNERGKPDWLVAVDHRWLALEFKREANASRRKNQGYHISRMNAKGLALFCYPENWVEVQDEICRYFGID